jgi:hypothetical protein
MHTSALFTLDAYARVAARSTAHIFFWTCGACNCFKATHLYTHFLPTRSTHTRCQVTIANIKKLFATRPKLPIFGICLGHQLMSIACGGKTYKLPYVTRAFPIHLIWP